MADEVEKVDRADVYMFDIEPRQCGIDGCVVVATKRIGLDFRDIGQSVVIGEYCDECAAIMHKRIRRTLPEPPR